MAQKRSSQRGVVNIASSLLVLVFATLLGLAGCSAGDGSTEAGENVDAVQQGICLKGQVCCGVTSCTDFGPCVGVTCNVNTCVYTDAPELTACKGPDSEGVCVTKPRSVHPICCTGCRVNGATKGTYDCVDAPTVGKCGAGGAVCKNCDGGDTCTKYSCDTVQGGCATPVPLDDKQPCTDQTGTCWKGSCCTGCIDGNDSCQTGTATTSCGASTAQGLVKCKDCTDGEPTCTTDSCNAGQCANTAVDDDTACPDANKCDGAETCQGGKCTDQANFSCPADTDPCHAPTCDPVKGCGQQLLSNVSCSDNNVCNGAEMCQSGTCSAGTALNCDDKDPCTVDGCDAQLGCVHKAAENGLNCDTDSDACNGVNSCLNGKCTQGTPVDCDDNEICTDDSCVKKTGQCVHANNTAGCSDNDLCTTTDVCSGGKCVGSGAPNCDDNNPCTKDTCKNGCQHDAVADNTGCDDGNACSTGDTCVKGKCLASGGKTCDDSNPCTQNTCDVNTQTCGFPNEKDGTACVFDQCHQNSACDSGSCKAGTEISCDDSNPCTTDSCDPAAGCKHVNANGGDCSDADNCTLNDKCAGGKCVGTPKTCAALDECHLAGTCNDGDCDDKRAPNDTSCDKGAGSCQSGICEPNPQGGAGGQGSGEAGAPDVGTGGSQGTAGKGTTQGGGPPVTGNGGAGNEPTGEGGENTPVTGGGKAGNGNSSGGTDTEIGEGGAHTRPEHPFVRDPGGCSCSTVSSQGSSDWAWLGALGLAAAASVRRRKTNRPLV